MDSSPKEPIGQRDNFCLYCIYAVRCQIYIYTLHICSQMSDVTHWSLLLNEDMVSQFFIHHLMLLFKGIKRSNRCWLWVHLWCEAALLPCTFWFLFSRGVHWCAVGALNTAIHYLNRHCAECKTLLVLTSEMKFSCCDHSLFWQKCQQREGVLGERVEPTEAVWDCLISLFNVISFTLFLAFWDSIWVNWSRTFSWALSASAIISIILVNSLSL